MATIKTFTLSCKIFRAAFNIVDYNQFCEQDFCLFAALKVDNKEETVSSIFENSKPKCDLILDFEVNSKSIIAIRLYVKTSEIQNFEVANSIIKIEELLSHTFNKIEDISIVIEMETSSIRRVFKDCTLFTHFNDVQLKNNAVESLSQTSSLNFRKNPNSYDRFIKDVYSDEKAYNLIWEESDIKQLEGFTPSQIYILTGQFYNEKLSEEWQMRINQENKIYYLSRAKNNTITFKRPLNLTLQQFKYFLLIHGSTEELANKNWDKIFHFEDPDNCSHKDPFPDINKIRELFKDASESVLGAYPPGWQRRIDPIKMQAYFANINTKSTTWNDPRLDWLNLKRDRLPEQYLMRYTSNGIPFFVNINTHRTSYTDPRTHLRILPDSNLFRSRKKSLPDKKNSLEFLMISYPFGNSVTLYISRENILEDSIKKIMELNPSSLKSTIRISYKFEVGSDGGGLFRDWILNVSHKIIDKATGQDKSLSKNILPSVQISYEIFKYQLEGKFYLFVGRIIGIIIWNKLLMPNGFNKTFYKKILGYHLTFDDLENFDADIFASLNWLKKNNIEEQNLDLYFCVDFNINSNLTTVELIPGGLNIKVLESNKEKYIQLLSDWYLNKSTENQFQAIKEGLCEIFPPTWLQYFNESEFELILCGEKSYDWDDLKYNTIYIHILDDHSEQIKWFWDIVEHFNMDHQDKLFQFITGGRRVPIGGLAKWFSHKFGGRFTISWDMYSPRLPTSGTCSSRLHIPAYHTKEEMEKKLIMAIENNEGFYNA